MADTAIEWTDKVWNPTVGCTKISAGCKNCYAKALHDQRHKAHAAGKQMPQQYAKPFEVLQLMPERLRDPLSWRKPRRVFVNSVSDLFHEDVPDGFIDRVFAVMGLAHWHTFQVLTKRPERMAAYFAETFQVPPRPAGHTCGVDIPATPARTEDRWSRINAACDDASLGDLPERCWAREGHLVGRPAWPRRPFPNVWLGVSCEDQAAADARIPHLLATPAAVRFLSCEPLISPVDLSAYLGGSQDGNRGLGRARDGRSGDVHRGPGGAGVAPPGDHAGEFGRRTGSRDRAAPSGHGAVETGWLSSGAVHGREDSLPHGRAPAGVDGREQEADPGRDGGEPQGRRQGQQPSGQPGTHDTLGERPARPAHTGVHEEPEDIRGEADAGAGGRDPSPVRYGCHVEGGDRGALQGHGQDGAQHRYPGQVGGHPRIHWVIVGGESGHGARPFDLAWARSLVEQCKAAAVACFVKQLGSNPAGDTFPDDERDPATGNRVLHVRQTLTIRDPKGGDMSEWPSDLRVRQFPAPAGTAA